MFTSPLPLLLLLLLLPSPLPAAAESELVTLTAEDKQQMLDIHNRLRAMTARGEIQRQPPAADMKLLEWDDRLQRSAEEWVQQCRIGHDSASDRALPGHSWVGQNWAGGYFPDGAKYVQMWFDEYKDYTFANGSCTTGRMCGHYTQVVWANSLLIGCGVARCSRYPFHLVCNYATGGNYAGQKPYQPGPAASRCDGEFVVKDNGVCVTTEQSSEAGTCSIGRGDCQHGGKYDGEACECRCKDGFYGARCGKRCADRPKWRYTCRTRGYKDCAVYGQYCRKTCNMCRVVGPDDDAENVDEVVARATA